MKKRSILTAALCCIAATVIAAPSVPPPMTFENLRAATISQAREKALKTGKLTYQIFDDQNQLLTTMTVWLEKPCKVRINIQKKEDSFAVGWDGNEEPWGCDKSNGVFPLSAEGKQIFFQDIHLLPVITPEINYVTALVPETTEVYDGIDCNVYRATPAQGVKMNFRIFVAEKTSLICRGEMEEDGVPAVFTLRGYKEIEGVKVPGRITISGAEGSRTFLLVSAKFDMTLPDGIFTRPEAYAKCNFGSGEIVPVPQVRKPVATTNSEREKQEMLVKKLEIQIQAEKDKMDKMEKLYLANQDDAVKLRSSAVRYRSWRYWGYSGYSSGYTSNRSAARRLERQNKDIGKAYRDSMKKLTDLELKLAEAKEKLAQMSAK